jgi:hypothetical protein
LQTASHRFIAWLIQAICSFETSVGFQRTSKRYIQKIEHFIATTVRTSNNNNNNNTNDDDDVDDDDAANDGSDNAIVLTISSYSVFS